jgi:hypothetical protein
MRRPDTPEILWHYTDAAGLFGIVSSARLRFGDARFLNDRRERTYGERLMNEIFDELIRGDESGPIARFRRLVGVLRLPERLYICSFSATEASISQWQRYGADGNGYCIGFARKQLDELLDKEYVSRVDMLYNEADQRELMQVAIEQGANRLLRHETSADRSYYGFLDTNTLLDSVILQMKSRHFDDEQEWRYVFRSRDDESDVTDETQFDGAEDELDDSSTSDYVGDAFAVRGN